MNILVYDDRNAIATVVRAALAGRRHRVSTSSDPDDASLKLETGLFDALVIGPGGAPRDLADYIEAEWPAMPIILAGMACEVPVADPIVAVLRAPLRIDDLAGAVRKLENKEAADRRKMFDMPIDVIAGERRLACRVVISGRDSLFLERLAAEGEPPVDLRDARAVTLERLGQAVQGQLAFADHSAVGVKYLGVRLNLEAARSLLEAAEPAPEPAEFPAGVRLGQEDPLELDV
jgi:hypothetical protein